jgi:hypothetical protein
MLKLDPDHLVEIDLASGLVWMHTGVISDLPLLCYGWSGVNSLVELVMVNRRVRGNRKVLASFSSYGRCLRRGERNVNVASASTQSEGTLACQLEMMVSTCSKSQYAALGKLVFGDESHFFNLPQRTASVSHAEAKHYGSREVDSLLQQNTAGIPAIAAGGVRCVCFLFCALFCVFETFLLLFRDLFVQCPIELIAREALQLRPPEEGEEAFD